MGNLFAFMTLTISVFQYAAKQIKGELVFNGDQHNENIYVNLSIMFYLAFYGFMMYVGIRSLKSNLKMVNYLNNSLIISCLVVIFIRIVVNVYCIGKNFQDYTYITWHNSLYVMTWTIFVIYLSARVIKWVSLSGHIKFG